MKVKLDDVIDRITGNVDRFNTELEYYVGGEHYDYASIAIYNKGLLKSEKGSTLGFKFHFPFKKGDTLFMARNPHLKKAGMVTYDGICSDASYVLRTKDPEVLLPNFLPLIIQNDLFWAFFEANKSGSVNYLMNWKEMRNYEFELPSIERQKAIADMVWAAERTRKGYIKLIEASNELVKSQFIEMFADTPKGKLSDIATITMGQSPDGKTYNTDGNGMCFYQGKTEFRDLYIGEATTWTTAPSRIAEANDVLMSVRAPVGSTNIATQTCCLGRGLAGIRPIEGKSTTIFILYSMRSIEDDIENMGVGSTFKAINKDVVYNLSIPLATIELQNKFVALAEQSDKSKLIIENTKN